MDYPDHCIRGITVDKHIMEEENWVHSVVFYPGDQTRDQRQDGWNETSINWNDDENAVPFTLNSTKENGSKKFRAGLVLLPRDEIERINALPATLGLLSYERQPLSDNPYHGNILIRQDLPKAKEKQLAASLATAVSQIIRSE